MITVRSRSREFKGTDGTIEKISWSFMWPIQDCASMPEKRMYALSMVHAWFLGWGEFEVQTVARNNLNENSTR